MADESDISLSSWEITSSMTEVTKENRDDVDQASTGYESLIHRDASLQDMGYSVLGLDERSCISSTTRYGSTKNQDAMTTSIGAESMGFSFLDETEDELVNEQRHINAERNTSRNTLHEGAIDKTASYRETAAFANLGDSFAAQNSMGYSLLDETDDDGIDKHYPKTQIGLTNKNMPLDTLHEGMINNRPNRRDQTQPRDGSKIMIISNDSGCGSMDENTSNGGASVRTKDENSIANSVYSMFLPSQVARIPLCGCTYFMNELAHNELSSNGSNHQHFSETNVPFGDIFTRNELRKYISETQSKVEKQLFEDLKICIAVWLSRLESKGENDTLCSEPNYFLDHLARAKYYLTDPNFNSIQVNYGHLVWEDQKLCNLLNSSIGRYRYRTTNAFLFLNAPMALGSFVGRNGELKEITYEDDVRFRNDEINRFENIFDGCYHSPKFKSSVTSKAAAEEVLRKFFDSHDAKRAHIVWIFFNGHGTKEQGLCFNEGDPWSITDFSSTVHNFNNDIRCINITPKPVQIVFAQCWGHSFNLLWANSLKTEAVYVYSISDDTSETRNGTFRELLGNPEPTGSEHKGLMFLVDKCREVLNLTEFQDEGTRRILSKHDQPTYDWPLHVSSLAER